MPVTDALLYLHGSGASAFGPITTTKKVFNGTIVGTTLTVNSGTSGNLLVGDVISGVGVSANTIITAIGTLTAVLGLGTYTVSVSQAVGPVAMTATPDLQGDLIGVGGAAQESNLELDFGPPVTGLAYPWLPAFPSLAEKAYTFPPEVVGDGGIEMGLHILITGPISPGSGNTGGARVDVQSNATTGATSVIASRTFTQAQLAVAGAHYFIPVNLVAVLEFLRFLWTNLATAATVNFTGSIVAWFGPKTGGEQ
jgi:hypothetical protein